MVKRVNILSNQFGIRTNDNRYKIIIVHNIAIKYWKPILISDRKKYKRRKHISIKIPFLRIKPRNIKYELLILA